MFKIKLFSIAVLLVVVAAGTYNVGITMAATISPVVVSPQNLELIKKLQALVLQLQAQLLQLQLQENKVDTTSSENESAKSFLYVKNIETNDTPSATGRLSATAGDRIEFTWQTQSMKECNFAVNDGLNNSLVKNEGYKVIVAPEEKGTYTYSVGCTDIKGQYHYTPVTVSVTAESSVAPTIVLEVKNYTKNSALTSKSLTVEPGDEISIRWNASGYDSCELRHSSYNEIISYNTTGYLSNFVSARAGTAALISISCEKDVDGPDISGGKNISVITSDPEGVASQKG